MKAITHKLKQSLFIWLFVILPLAGLSPSIMADDEASPPEATPTEESEPSGEEKAEGAEEEAPAELTPYLKELEGSAPEDYFEEVKKQGADAPAYDFFVTSMLWTVMAAALVFLMHLGFSSLEIGLTRAKNTVNILFKNAWIIAIGLITYALWGFNTHYPSFEEGQAWLVFGGNYDGDWMLGADDATWSYGGLSLAMTAYGDFIFQAMFAATAATIVSGAVAERIKLLPFLIFATLLVGIAYPIVGSWHWGEGYLNQMETPFYDFAGSAVVHAFGGFAALACVLILGPRKGKYTDEGMKPIPGHSMPFAAVGVFLLWFGWYGFNGGSVLSAEPGGLGLVFTTTSLAAAAGVIGAAIVSWVVFQKPDLSMALNGALAGLVGITANANIVSPGSAIVIGLVAGVIVVASVVLLDKLQIDDPVGAISVHGTCGIWGILAAYIFQMDGSGVGLGSQIKGIALVAVAAFVFSAVVFYALKLTIGVRVSEEEEEEGLDKAEHGSEAYPDFN